MDGQVLNSAFQPPNIACRPWMAEETSHSGCKTMIDVEALGSDREYETSVAGTVPHVTAGTVPPVTMARLYGLTGCMYFVSSHN